MMVRELIWRLGFDVDDKQLKQAENGVRSLGKEATSLGTTLKLAVSPMAALQPAVKQAVARAVDRVNPL